MYRQPKVQKFSLESDRNCIPQEVGMLEVKVRQVVDIRNAANVNKSSGPQDPELTTTCALI